MSSSSRQGRVHKRHRRAESSAVAIEAAPEELDDYISKELSHGKSLIRRGQGLAASGDLEEANENYVRGLQKICGLDQSDPRVAGMQRKLAKYVDEAERLQQRLDQERIRRDAEEHQSREDFDEEEARGRRRRRRRQDIGERSPEASRRHVEPISSRAEFARQRRARDQQRMDRSRSRERSFPDEEARSYGNYPDEGLTLRPRINLVPGPGADGDSDRSEF